MKTTPQKTLTQGSTGALTYHQECNLQETNKDGRASVQRIKGHYFVTIASTQFMIHSNVFSNNGSQIMQFLNIWGEESLNLH